MNDTNNAAAETVEPIRYFAKCTRCKTLCRVELPAERRTLRVPVMRNSRTGRTEYADRVRRVAIMDHESIAYLAIVLNDPRASDCWTCGRALKFDKIVGTVTEHKCSALCMASKGPSCECACGGKNHGSSWA